MSKKKSDKELADSLKSKGFYETHADYVESLGLLSYSQKMENFQEKLLDVYKKKLNKNAS